MDYKEALDDLKSDSIDDRLTAARILVKEGKKGDLPFLVEVFNNESVPWIKHALSKAIERLSGKTSVGIGVNSIVADSEDAEYELIDEVKDHALKTTTQTLTHEIEPVLGRVIFFAKQELEDFEQTQTKRHLDRLKRMLEGIKTLGQVSGAPNLEQFDLKLVIDDAVSTEASRGHAEVQIARHDPMPVVGDRSYIELAFANGLRNAIEVTDVLEEEHRETVTVNFGKTDTHYWITVLDRGGGLKVSGIGIFELGNTSKEGHEGMGLALSQRAMKSLKGSVKLSPREGGGVRYEVRWPISIGVSDETSNRRRQN